MTRASGRIDFRLLNESSGAESLDSRLGALRLPGLELSWDPAHADAAAQHGVVALAWGRPRHDQRKPSEGIASWWIERYAKHGPNAPVDVGGGFAAAIVDTQRREACLFVDRFSIESLCWTERDGVVAFSDSASAVPVHRRSIDPQAIYDYLYLHAIPTPRTVYREIQRLRGAHRLVACGGTVRVDAYWTPTFVEDDHHQLRGRMQAFVAAVEQAVGEEADDRNTACFLSGGTDSSTIAGMLRRLRGAPVHAYSIGFDAEGYDEMEYARLAARHFGLEHHEHYVTPGELIDAMPKLAAEFDQPFGNSSVLPAYLCATDARGDGFTRMLAGDGGDELYAGNARYATQKVFETYQALPGPLRERLLEPLAVRPLFRTVPGFRQVGGYIRHSRHPMPDRLDTFNLLDRIGQDRLLSPDFLAEVDRERPLREKRSIWSECRDASLVNRMLAYDWKYTLADSDLPKVRIATAAAGVTVGYPFLCRAVVDLSLRLPPEWKLKGLKLRWFFKQALRDFLPAEILRKKKHGFGLPFGVWVLRDPALRDFVRGAMQDTCMHDILAQGGLDRLEKSLPEGPGYYGEMVWLLAMLGQWLAAHPEPAVDLPSNAPRTMSTPSLRH